MKWYEAKSVKELKSIGKLKEVKLNINDDLKAITGRSKIEDFIKMGSNSWNSQYEKIQALKKVINIFPSEVGEGTEILNSEDNGKKVQAMSEVECNYFKSESDRYIFCLLELSGEQRMKQLKIYKSLYINRNAAKEWYYEIARSIHPDTCKNKKASEAMAELTSIYNKMVENE